MQIVKVELEIPYLKRYDLFFIGGVIFWIMQNIYFGWNATPQSGAERICDFISSISIAYGLLFGIAQDVSIAVLKRSKLDFVATQEVIEVNHLHGKDAPCVEGCDTFEKVV